jgi:hypothetical protein
MKIAWLAYWVKVTQRSLLELLSQTKATLWAHTWISIILLDLQTKGESHLVELEELTHQSQLESLKEVLLRVEVNITRIMVLNNQAWPSIQMDKQLLDILRREFLGKIHRCQELLVWLPVMTLLVQITIQIILV